MDLSDIRDRRSEGVDLLRVARTPSLLRQIQERLAFHGLLDPPSDADLGPVSHWAWSAFCSRAKLATMSVVAAEHASALLDERALFPVKADGAGLADRIVRSMQALDYWVSGHPDCITIAYVEGVDTEGRRIDNAINAYNDIRAVVSIRDGSPVLLGAWTATTQPGWHWILQPMDGTADPVKGAAHVALGQYKAWCVGTHNGSRPHEALVQRGKVRIHRDHNRDGSRERDPQFVRADYGINQHHGGDSTRVEKYSAGCLVGNRVAEHRAFMALVKADARYKASNAYKFMTAILAQEQLLP